MTTSTARARHRQARRPITTLVSSATGNAAVIGRRTAVVAASSGLLVSFMGTGAAMAAPASSPVVGSVDVSALTAQARAALSTAPTVTVAADATWTVEQTAVSVTPKPKAEPKPVRAVAATRSAERTALAATATEAVETAVAIPAAAAGSSIIDIASRYVGVPYVSGGSTPDGFDCSGFTAYVFAQAGVSLPRTSSAQKAAGTIIPRDQAQAGDLIWTPGHISIYAGGDTQIDSPQPGKTIQFRSIWQANPVFIRIG